MKKTVQTSEKHEMFYQEMIELIGKYNQNMNSEETLAIVANLIGKLIALMDQRTITPEKAMQIVHMNIANGNKQVIDKLIETEGTMQ